jgi:WD40 repeat protein
MTANQIGLEMPQKELNLKIGSEKNSFPVIVINDSNQFASFQIDIIPSGIDAQDVNYEWFTVSPDVSVKIPPGDLVEFVVSIIETPISGFTGIMNITVRVFSIELREENRAVMRIILEEGAGRSHLDLDAPFYKIQAPPLEDIEIPILIGNPSKQNTNVTLTCLDLPDSWLPKGNIQQFPLKPGAKFKITFLCRPPFDHEAISQLYNFTIAVSHTNGSPSESQCTLEVLPKGSLEFLCSPKKQTIPANRTWTSWWKFWESSPAIFTLIADNASNLPQKIDFEIENVQTSDYSDFSFEISPNDATVEPFSKTELILEINKSRSWFAKVQKLYLFVKANWQDPRVNTVDEIQAVEVVIKPVIPIILVVLLTLLMLIPTWWLSWLNPNNPFPPHKGAVTSVQFDGTGTYGISSSNDRTMRKWDVDGFHLPWVNQDLGSIGEAQKAIRVVRFRPVNNDLVAAGLENGEIQIWDAHNISKSPLATFSNQSDDRVFDLAYTLDSRTLFSGHGSGTVLRWDLQNLFTNPPTQPSQIKKFDFAVTSIALVGKDDSTLAIAGRYNQLVLWNWVKDTVKVIPYPKLGKQEEKGGQDDYIQSLSATDRKRSLLATGDNQGYMSVWDLKTCLQSNRPCEMLDGWESAHHGKPVRSVAFSDEGCYLASGGDDKEVKLWMLTGNGKRVSSFINGKTLEVRPSNVTAVDIHLTNKDVLTMIGTAIGRVVGQQSERLFNLGCDVNQ